MNKVVTSVIVGLIVMNLGFCGCVAVLYVRLWETNSRVERLEKIVDRFAPLTETNK